MTTTRDPVNRELLKRILAERNIDLDQIEKDAGVSFGRGNQGDTTERNRLGRAAISGSEIDNGDSEDRASALISAAKGLAYDFTREYRTEPTKAQLKGYILNKARTDADPIALKVAA